MNAAILNQGAAAWAFEDHGRKLANALWLELTNEPRDYNYLLGWQNPEQPPGTLFIDWEAIQIASDKRLQALAFNKNSVKTPFTKIVETLPELHQILNRSSTHQWVLKYPTGCGGTGHRIVTANSTIPADWPRPFVIQEFIQMDRPEVHRLLCVAGEVFGWNARRFPDGSKISPWVAHARGARYVHLGHPPTEAKEAAISALAAAGLTNSFGAVDLLRSERGWVVLEVGTDGLFSHVDRDFDSTALQKELDQRVAEAFWSRSEKKPWGAFGWKPRTAVEVQA